MFSEMSVKQRTMEEHVAKQLLFFYTYTYKISLFLNFETPAFLFITSWNTLLIRTIYIAFIIIDRPRCYFFHD